MGRPSLVAMITALLSIQACRPNEPASTDRSRPAAQRADAAPAPGPVAPAIGSPLSLSGDTGSSLPQVAVDARGALLVAWFEGGSVVVKRWRGSSWESLGAANDGVATGPYAMALAADGSPMIAWARRTAGRGDEVHAARWSGREWTAMGGNLSPVQGGVTITHMAAAVADDVFTVAFGERRGDAQGGLHAARWTGTAWMLSGPPSLIPAGSSVLSLAATTCADGTVVLAWVENATGGSPTLQVRRWDAQRTTWDVLPRGNSPTVDVETTTLSMAPSDGGAFYLAYGWHHGLHPVVRWSPESNDYVDLGIPQDSLRRSSIDAGPAIASGGGALVYAWRARGGRLGAARLDGRAWRPITATLDTERATEASVGLGPQGQLYAVFVDLADGGRRVTVASAPRAN